MAFCPTQEMIVGFFTKPLQGAIFVRMHEKILNLPASKIANVHRSVLENRKSADLINARQKIKMTRRKETRLGHKTKHLMEHRQRLALTSS